MPWLKLLHIAALVIWCASLLYLPALLSQALQLRKDSGFAQGTPVIRSGPVPVCGSRA